MPINLRGRTKRSDAGKRLKAIEKGGPNAKVPVTIRALMQRCNRGGKLSVEKVYQRELDLFLVNGVLFPLGGFETKAREFGMLRPWESLATE